MLDTATTTSTPATDTNAKPTTSSPPPTTATTTKVSSMSQNHKNEAAAERMEPLSKLQSELLVHAKTLKKYYQQTTVQKSNADSDLFSKQSLEHCHDLLDQLLEIRPMTFELLQSSNIGKCMGKLASLKTANTIPFLALIGKRAQAIILYWNASMGCRERTLQQLRQFQALSKQFANEGRAKPDMQAYKQLRNTKHHYGISRIHGPLPNIPIGLKVHGRGEAAILGIHNTILSGIDAEKDGSCFAVCMSGKYYDQEEEYHHLLGDNKDNDNDNDNHKDDDNKGVIVYTGTGGLNKQGVLVNDQTSNSPNQSLMRSCATGDPIRVLRRIGSKGMEYRYEGLYQCIDYTYQPFDATKKTSPKVYRFTLKPMPFQTVYFIRHYLKKRTLDS